MSQGRKKHLGRHGSSVSHASNSVETLDSIHARERGAVPAGIGPRLPYGIARWTGAQVGRGKAEESKVAPGPTVKQTLPQEPAPFRRPHPTPHTTLHVSSFFHSPSWLRLWHLRRMLQSRASLIVRLMLKLALSYNHGGASSPRHTSRGR
eukprot:scaffold18376_cov60-Phaeocystis_antarctica.AAC.2